MNPDSKPERPEQRRLRFLYLGLISMIAAAPLMATGRLTLSLLLLVVLTAYNALLYLSPQTNRGFRDGRYVPSLLIFFTTMFATWGAAWYRFD